MDNDKGQGLLSTGNRNKSRATAQKNASSLAGKIRQNNV
jgi:hypothetical protein